jgi:hypothetical protein
MEHAHSGPDYNAAAGYVQRKVAAGQLGAFRIVRRKVAPARPPRI